MGKINRSSFRGYTEKEIRERMGAFWQRMDALEKYYEFIDTGKLSPLAETVIKSPENSDLLMFAISMLENYKGYPWVIRRQVKKTNPSRDNNTKPSGRPADPVELVDQRLTYIKIAIEKYESWLSWAGHKKITDKMLLEKIWLEDLPPMIPMNVSAATKYSWIKKARQHKPIDALWRNDVEIILMENDLDFMNAFMASEAKNFSK